MGDLSGWYQCSEIPSLPSQCCLLDWKDIQPQGNLLKLSPEILLEDPAQHEITLEMTVG